MDLNLNINNKQKHWLLVIIEKCKTAIMAFLKGILKCILWIGRLLKKIWKYILGLVIIGALIGGGVAAYDYYTYTYIPQKKLDAAIEEILAGINSPNDSIKTEYALYVLDKKHEWGFEDVSNYDISSRLYGYRESSFKLIEAKAFAGEAKYQFRLGQFYYWGDSNYHYIESDKTKAAYWWNEAASQNYTLAYNNLGIAYKDGNGVEIDLRKAVHYLKLGAEAGEDWAQRNYGDLFMEGVKIKVGSHKEIRSTQDYYRGSDDDVISKYYDYSTMNFITRYYETVDDYETLIPKDIEQAKSWWKKSAAQGNEVAKERLQKIYN